MFAFYCLLPVIEDNTLIRVKDYITGEILYLGLMYNFRNKENYICYIVEWIYPAGSELVIELKEY